jgi:hypothetical protein
MPTVRTTGADTWRRGLRCAALGIALACVDTPGVARAQSGDVQSIDVSRCAGDTQARLGWLVERLESREQYADLWWRGWIGFYGLGVVVQSVRAGIEDDRGDRADYVVGAVKALGGVTRLYFSRPTARLGADPLLDGAFTDETACRSAVDDAETLLRKAAHESDRRWRLTPHLVNLGINVAGGVIVAEGFDEDDGWISAAIGIAVGEAMLWSHPWKGRSDLTEYEARFTVAANPDPTWAIAPYRRGLSVQVRF